MVKSTIHLIEVYVLNENEKMGNSLNENDIIRHESPMIENLMKNEKNIDIENESEIEFSIMIENFLMMKFIEN